MYICASPAIRALNSSSNGVQGFLKIFHMLDQLVKPGFEKEMILGQPFTSPGNIHYR